jgi:hypothetical protein
MRVPRRTSDLFAFLFDSRSAPVLFIAAALLMAAMGNAFYDLVTDVIGNKSRGSLALIIASGLVLIVIVVLGLKGLAEIFFRRQPPRIGGSTAFLVKRRAIIFSVGKQSDTIALCLRHQHPEFVGFVCTADSERFTDDLIASHGLNSKNCFKKVVDPWDISEVRDMTRDLLAKLVERSIPPAEIVFDITGALHRCRWGYLWPRKRAKSIRNTSGRTMTKRVNAYRNPKKRCSSGGLHPPLKNPNA